MSNLTGNISKMWTPFLPVPNCGNLFQSDRFQSINYFIFTLNYIYWTWVASTCQMGVSCCQFLETRVNYYESMSTLPMTLGMAKKKFKFINSSKFIH